MTGEAPLRKRQLSVDCWKQGEAFVNPALDFRDLDRELQKVKAAVGRLAKAQSGIYDAQERLVDWHNDRAGDSNSFLGSGKWASSESY